MIEFILVACMAGDPSVCRTETRLLTDMTLVQCMTSAQFLVADWQGQHEGWEVGRHRCEIHNSSQVSL